MEHEADKDNRWHELSFYELFVEYLPTCIFDNVSLSVLDSRLV